MLNQFSRTELLFGKNATKKLEKAKVAVFGIGGVGCSVVETLARSGIGYIDLIDNDKFSITNLNRQLYATYKTIDKYKVDVAKERILEINPNCIVNTYKIFYVPEIADNFSVAQYDYIADAIDTISGKIALVKAATELNVPIISSMGTGNKINPCALKVADIYETSVCPLARVMRKELQKSGIKNLKVVYSQEQPIKPQTGDEISDNTNKIIPGSTAFVPTVAGTILAGEIIKDLLKK